MDFRFERINARPFVTIDVAVPDEEENPTAFAARAIERRNVDGAVARVRLKLSSSQSVRLGDADLRQALSSAHYIASISREVTDTERRRIVAEPADLQPIAALRLYLQSREVSAERQELMLQRAEQILTSIDVDE